MNILRNKIKGDKKVILSNFISLSVLQAANYILPLIVIPFLVRVLGPEKFGLVMFAQAIATFLKVMVDFGFELSGTRAISVSRNDKERLSDLFSSIITIKLFLTILSFALLVMIVEFFTRFQFDSAVYYLSFGLVIGNAIFPVWFFQGIEKMKFVTLINILAKTIFTILIFLVLQSEEDFLLVPIFNSLGIIIAGGLGFLLSLQYVRLTIPKRETMRVLLYDSSSLFISSFSVHLCTTVNVLILGLFTNNTMVGIYSSMEKLILAIKNVYSPLYQALFPWLAVQTRQEGIRIIKRLTPVVFVVSCIITFLILLYGKDMLYFIYRDENILEYIEIFQILSLVSIFAALHMLYNALFLPAIKKYKTRMLILTIGGIFNVLLSLYLISRYGIYGTAFSVISTEFVLLVLGYYFFRKYSKDDKLISLKT